jgi:serine/threonine protein kinase
MLRVFMEERYEIKGRIGRGGIGAVYQAYDRRLGRDVAIKRMLPLSETKLNDSASVSLEKEALALAKFQHPNVVSIYEIASDDEGSFVVFELVKGETLKATIARSAFTLEDFISFADQTLDPLISAQELNLLHRDIKPGNIMLSWLESANFRVKLLDFGLAKFSQAPSTQTLDQTGSFLGSIDYIAPEQIEVGLLDQRTDLYSMGCVYYFSLTQNAPFAGPTVTKTMDNHLRNNVVPLGSLRPDLPPPLIEWIMRLISRRPENRPLNAVHAMELFQQVRNASKASPEIVVSASSLPHPTQPKLALPPVPATAPQEMDTAQLEPTKQLFSRHLHTQQIVRNPAAKSAPAARQSRAGDSRPGASGYQAKPAKSFNKKLIYGVTGLFTASLFLLGFVISQDRKQQQMDPRLGNGTKSEPTPSLHTSAPSNSEIQNSTSQDQAAPKASGTPAHHSLENTNLPASLPPLPAASSLVAYLSVGGKMQNQNGDPYQNHSTTESLGAIENIAPGAHEYHLLRRPDDDNLIPKIYTNAEGYLSVFCPPGYKLGTPFKGFQQQTIESPIYTFSLLFRVPASSYGGLFRITSKDAKDVVSHNSLKLTFSNDTISGAIGERQDQSKSEFPAEEFRVVFLELDTSNNTLKSWQRGSESNGKLIAGNPIPANLDGPIRLMAYEYGYLWFSKTKSDHPVEIPAMAIHTSTLSDAEKHEVADKLFQGFQRK